MNTEQIRRGFRVSGRVQGVGFRYWTRDQAHQLGLRGYVRNDRDGSVHVIAAGPEDAVRQLEAQLRQGPPGARVASVETLNPPDEELPAWFEIRR